MKYLLDTDHISFLQRGVWPEFAVLSLRLSQQSAGDVVLCIVSFHEQVIGGHSLINRARTTKEVVRGYALLSTILQSYLLAPVLPFDDAAGAVIQMLETAKLGIQTMDLRLASVALSRGLTLLTRNKQDFSKVPGLTIEDWTI